MIRAIGILIITGLLFSCSRNTKPTYQLHVSFDNVSRLKVGDSVFYNTKSIGVVSQVSFLGSNQDSVDVLIIFNPNIPPIPKPSSFTIKPTKIFGKRQIEVRVIRESGDNIYQNNERIQGTEYTKGR